MIELERIKTCWITAWGQWLKTDEKTEHGKGYGSTVYPMDEEEPDAVDVPDPYRSIIERCNYADAAVFDTFPEVRHFARPMITGEAWPADTEDVNSVRVALFSEGIRTRLFFYKPGDVPKGGVNIADE